MTDLEYTPIPDPLPDMAQRIDDLEAEAAHAYSDLISLTKLLLDCGLVMCEDNKGRLGFTGRGQTFFPPRPNAATQTYLDRLSAPGVERK